MHAKCMLCIRHNSPNLRPNPALSQELETKCKNKSKEWETGPAGGDPPGLKSQRRFVNLLATRSRSVSASPASRTL